MIGFRQDWIADKLLELEKSNWFKLVCVNRRFEILKVHDADIHLAFQKIADAFLFDAAAINIG